MERHLGDCLRGAARRAIPLVLGALLALAAGPVAALDKDGPTKAVRRPRSRPRCRPRRRWKGWRVSR